MKCSEPAPAIRQTVNHDVASGGKALGRGAIDVVLLRIRNVQSEMVVAVGLVEVDRVNAFRGALIALVFLGFSVRCRWRCLSSARPALRF